MVQLPAAFTLPRPLQHRLEALSRSFTEPAPGERGFDFAAPAGEPALAAPDSVSWRVFKNPVTLFIGGVGAVLLELAEAARARRRLGPQHVSAPTRWAASSAPAWRP
jgi:hypothetical protein